MSYSAEDEKNNALPAFDPARAQSRANKINALKSYVDQNQTSSAPNALKSKTISSGNTVANINKAQEGVSALTVQQGSQVEADTKKDTTGSGLAVTKTDIGKPVALDTSGARGVRGLQKNEETTVGVSVNGVTQSDTVIDNAVTADIAALDVQKTKLIGSYTTLGRTLDTKALEDLAKLDAQMLTLREKLNKIKTTDLAEVGQTNAVEAAALDDADSLTATPTSNVGYLQRMFGQDYDTSKFGALDSQVYNKDINDARKTAADNTSEMEKQRAGKINAAKSFLGSVKNSKETMDKFDTDFRKSVNDNKEADQKTLDTYKETAERLYKSGVFGVEENAKDLKTRNAETVVDVNLAKSKLGDVNFNKWSKNLNIKDPLARDFTFTTPEGKIAQGRRGMEMAMAAIEEAQKKDGYSNNALRGLYDNLERAMYHYDQRDLNDKNTQKAAADKAVSKAKATPSHRVSGKNRLDV